MSYVHPIEIVENDVLIVSVLDTDGRYFMWQKGLTKDAGVEEGIYFEFDDQSNGGHNLITECRVARDSINVTLANGSVKGFCFPHGFDKHKELEEGLNKIYAEKSGVLVFNI